MISIKEQNYIDEKANDLLEFLSVYLKDDSPLDHIHYVLKGYLKGVVLFQLLLDQDKN